MKTYAALLRAVNLGSKNKVSMPELRELFVALGAEDVATYVQSGNVVFRSRATSSDELKQTIEKQLSRDLGLTATVLLRTNAELARIAGGSPFEQPDPKKLHVTFLAEKPERARVRELEAIEFPPDEFRVSGREVYLHCPDGYGRSKLSNAYFEKQLGVVGTTRNWNTVTKLAELTSGLAKR